MLTTDVSSPAPAKSTEAVSWKFVPSLYEVAFLAILGAIAIVALAPRLDTDFWWHLKVGQYVVNHHVVPSRDFLSYSSVGHAWTDHEWLAESIMYVMYRLAGLWGPIVLFAGIISATFTLVYLQMRNRGINRVLALFMVAAAFMTSSASWGPRVQMLTMFFLAVYLFVLNRFEQTKDRRLLIVFPALMLVWTNVHGGFVLGLAVLAITLLGEWLNRVTKHTESWSRDDLRALGIALVAAAGVTMINPNGYRQLLYPLQFLLPNAYTNLIEESASPNFHMPVIMLFEVLLLLLVGATIIGRPRLNWTHLLFVIAFTHLALSQVRNVAVWAVVVIPIVALYAQAMGPALRAQFPGKEYRRRPVTGRLGPIMNLVLLALTTVAYLAVGTHFVNAARLRDAQRLNFPSKQIAYLQTHHLPPHVFASYGWGGYVLWNLYPRYRDFMDSRADTLFSTKILDDYLQMYAVKPGWQRALKRNQVQDVLVEPTAPLAQALAIDPKWKLVSKDSVGVLYTKR